MGGLVRLRTECRTSPIPWVPEEDDAVALARYLMEDAVMIANPSDLEEALEWVRELHKSGPSRSQLMGALTDAPACFEPRAPDVLILDSGTQPDEGTRCLTTTFARLFRDPALNDLRLKLRPEPMGGSSRDDLYKGWIEPLAACSQKVVIADPFLPKTATGRRSGAVWLLRRLVASGVKRIELLTVASDPDREGPILQDFLGQEPLLSELKKRDATVRVVVAPFNRKFHDRHLRFVFHPERRPVSITLGNGANVFAQPELREAYTIAPEGNDTARSREELVTRCQAPYKATIPA